MPVEQFIYEVNEMSSQPTQSKTIRAQLLSAMKDGEYANRERLPRESKPISNRSAETGCVIIKSAA